MHKLLLHKGPPEMVQIQFKLILNPESKLFELTAAGDSLNKRWDLTAKETEQLIRNARSQLLDATDAITEYTLHTGDYEINLKGITSREAFQAIVEYLDKVWNSFRGSRYYAEIYPQ